MAVIFESLFIYVIVSLLAIIPIGIVIYFKCAFNYWRKRNLPLVEEPKIPFGSLPNPFLGNISMASYFKNAYDAGKSQGYKLVGYFVCSIPKFIPIDREYIKNILQKDFNCFTERGFYYNEKDDPLSANLFALGGEKWRTLRTKLSPAYTSGKLKNMFDGLLQCTYQLQEVIEKHYKSNQTVNINDVSECFTIDVIGSCAFGLECNSFKNPEAEFKKQGKKAFFFTYLRLAKIVLAFCYPTFSRWLGIRLFDKEITSFFINVVKDSLKFRESNNLARQDFLQLLIDLKYVDLQKNSEEKLDLSIEELTAQVFIFFAAGFETSSITLTFCLYELSVNTYIQNKLREEIHQVLNNHEGKITYDAIMDMKYMNQVVEETLRKYPPVPFISRVAVTDYQIPGTEIVIEKGMQGIVSIFGVHRDPDYYPDPEKFDPERFSDENKQKQLPFTYIPFGEGPRICIGLRFGLMQVKAGLTALLKQYKFSLHSKVEEPLQMNCYSFTLCPKNDIFLNIEKVT